MKKLLSVLLAVTMLLAMGSGLVIFTSSAADYAKMALPGFNQYTPAQMDRMAKRADDTYEYGSNWQFEKDDEGHTIFNVTVPATGDTYGGYKCAFATADQYNQWRQNKLIDGLSPFGDVDMSNKLGFKFKVVNVGDVAFTGNIGFCFGSSTKRVAVDFRACDREGDYYVVRFGKTGWYGYTVVGESWYYDCPTLADTYYGVIDQFQMYFENSASMAGKRLKFYIDDFHAYGTVDSADLGRAIQAAKAAQVTPSLIETAEATYRAAEDHTQDEIDAIAKKLNDVIEEQKYGFEKAKNDLDELLTLADDLGFFDSTYEHYEDVSDADLAYADPNATLDELRYHVRVVRMLVLAETANQDVYDAFARCVNAWQYNYTDKSYTDVLTAIDEAWAIYEDDADGAIAILDAAYDALELLPVKATTADFFEGWTTTQVNDVVDANSDRLCDSIGEGLNIDGAWNAGDFSNNTIFEADGNFSMTALADFTGKAMGWKNMDRSKTLQTESNGAFPPMNVAGLSGADGVRFKLESTGSIDRILIGLSNCSSMTREMYAMRIRPELVASDGYINIPFSYFQKAFWCNAFAQEELDNVIVFIIEAYGLEEDTTVTVSDFRGYKRLENATSADAEKLAGIVAKLEAFDIDGKYADLLAEAGELNLADNYSSDYEDMYNAIFAVLKDYADPSVAIVDVPGFSIFTQEEMSQFPAYDGGGCTFIKTERGIKHTLSNGSWAFVPAKFTYVDDGSSFGEHDCFFGAVEPFDGKDLKAMLGGYTLNDIYAYRFKVENAAAGKFMNITYKDGVGLWNGMLTGDNKVYEGEDGYFTWIIDETNTNGAGDPPWYPKVPWTLDDIKTKAKYFVCSFYNNVNRDIYGWQVILFEAIDRSELKAALEQYKDLGLASYDDAMDTYYDKAADADAIAAAAKALNDAATPDAPAAPTAAEITYNSVTLTLGPDNIEYRMGENGEWTGNVEFTGLTPNTEYKFYARVAAIGGYNASEPSKPLTVKTAKAPVEGEVAIEGDAVYGATLTASVTGIGSNPGELTYSWIKDGAEVGSGSEYVIVKEDIGATLTVSVTAANYEGALTSEPTAAVEKATPVVAVAPTASAIMIGEKLGASQLSGGEADVEGEWAWVDPETVPELDQSGTTFPVIFTPADTDCYNTVTVDVAVTVTNNVEEISVTDDASGITLTGEFAVGAAPTIAVEEIKAGKPSYLALLRAARNSQGNTLILFKNVSVDSRYVGTLTLSAQLSADRAGETYTVWFFADGEVMSAQGVVDANGVIAVSDFIADVVA